MKEPKEKANWWWVTCFHRPFLYIHNYKLCIYSTQKKNSTEKNTPFITSKAKSFCRIVKFPHVLVLYTNYMNFQKKKNCLHQKRRNLWSLILLRFIFGFKLTFTRPMHVAYTNDPCTLNILTFAITRPMHICIYCSLSIW